eukprot:scaffold57841_cov58-Phaeocystis_antarctica.AAC.3
MWRAHKENGVAALFINERFATVKPRGACGVLFETLLPKIQQSHSLCTPTGERLRAAWAARPRRPSEGRAQQREISGRVCTAFYPGSRSRFTCRGSLACELGSCWKTRTLGVMAFVRRAAIGA